MAHVLEVVVAHVVEAQHEAALILGHGVADVLEQLLLLLARLLIHLGKVIHLASLRLGHFGRRVCESWIDSDLIQWGRLKCERFEGVEKFKKSVEKVLIGAADKKWSTEI